MRVVSKVLKLSAASWFSDFNLSKGSVKRLLVNECNLLAVDLEVTSNSMANLSDSIRNHL
jgi:hypothetical protein